MGLIIPNYKSLTGVILPNAYLTINNFYYDGVEKNLNFSLNIFASKQDYLNNCLPIENNAFFGILRCDYNDSYKIFTAIDNAILEKIGNVIDKTEEQCAQYNANLEIVEGADWILRWDYEYKRLEGAYIDIDEEK